MLSQDRKANMEKILILDACLKCPYYSSRIDELDEIEEDCLDEFCHLSNKKNPHKIDSDYAIPDWCKLETKSSDNTSTNNRTDAIKKQIDKIYDF